MRREIFFNLNCRADQQREIIPVLVVSALSDGCKKNGTTSMLLRMGDAVLYQDRMSIKTDLTALRSFHSSTANASLSEMVAKSFQEQANSVVAKLELFLDAAMTLGEVTPRTLDIIVSFGEYLSALFVSSYLVDKVP